MTNPFAKAINDMLNSQVGEDAIYNPTNSKPVPIRCFFNKDYFPELGMEGYKITVEALTSIIGAAKPGETITIVKDDMTYNIKEPPHAGNDGMSIVELSID